ncbi:MAG: hypothetical protein IJD92_02380 [Bacilli bacterium]|nr:hypothetical protein [Bacilli bacterium]
MDVKIEKIKKEDKIILERMLQLYLHDISSYFYIDFDSKTGLYKYDELDKYFDESENFAYFIKNNDAILGFSLVDIFQNENVIQEIFILNNYKGQSVGTMAAELIFEENKGNWVVRALPKSEKAEKFWYKSINQYTNNSFKIEHVGKYNRAIFTFNNENK